MGSAQNSSFLPASVDLVKSFFPTGGSGSSMAVRNTGLSAVQFHQNFPQNQDLKLSLQSFQDQMPQHQTVVGNNNIYFAGSGWPWNGGFVFNSLTAAAIQTAPFLQPLFGQPTNNQLLNYISQRGPLQSSNSPPVRAWVDPHQTPGFHHPFSLPGLLGGGARRQRRRERGEIERESASGKEERRRQRCRRLRGGGDSLFRRRWVMVGGG
ncbi:putative transcription factor, TCP [Helianthus anomalus]